MRSHITDQQFQKASAICAQVREIIAMRDAQLSAGLNPSLFKPSELWEAIELMAYCLNPSYEVVDTWRLHTYLFTGNHPFHKPLPWPGDPTPGLLESAGSREGAKMRKRYLSAIEGLASDLIVRPPRLFAETGWEVGGSLFNSDVLAIQTHVGALFHSGVIDALRAKTAPSVLEIGSGYGGLALALKTIVPSTTYHMIDLPESIVFAAVYLGIAKEDAVTDTAVYNDDGDLNVKDGKFHFVADFLADRLAGPVDLVINTGSFGEMSAKQVERYATLIRRVLAPDGLLYERNQDTFTPVTEILSARLAPVMSGGQKLWAPAASAAPQKPPPARPSVLRRARQKVADALHRAALTLAR